MSDDKTTLRTILHNDQALAEVNEVFVPIITAFRLMRGNGVPEENAGWMAQAFGEFVIDRHFGVDRMDLRMLMEGDE